MTIYTSYVTRPRPTGKTSQMKAIPGEIQVQNSAGGYVYQLDEWKTLDRFLILGTDSPTYYSSAKALTVANAKGIQELIKKDGLRVVARTVEISEEGRAPKNDPALFVLALAIAFGDTATKKAVVQALPKVARTNTHLYTFVQYASQFRGWGRVLRDAVANWYTSKRPDQLAYQAIKYQQRNGWSNRDLLRLSHTKAVDTQTNAIFHWMTKGWDSVGDMPHPEAALRQIWAFEKAKKATSAGEIVFLIRDYNLPREAIPTEYLRDVKVWEALLERMPLTAMIRNLATMSRVGLLVKGSPAIEKVSNELTNAERIKAARVHPLALISALKVYALGGKTQNVYGRYSDVSKSKGGEFTPLPSIEQAIEKAFYLSFGNVEPTGKSILLGLDVSESMGSGSIGGVPGLTPREATALMAMVTARAEWQQTTNGLTVPLYHSVAFSTTLTPFPLTPTESLEEVIERMAAMPFGGTDTSLPIKYALEKGLVVDTFISYTDNETWAGEAHTSEVLREYRKKINPQARNVNVAFTATDLTVADPKDTLSLDVVGFDMAAPELISRFTRGEV